MVQLQASLALVQNPEPNATVQKDQHGRLPFAHPALDGLKNLSPERKSFLTDRRQVAELARKYDMQKIIRWQPRNVCHPRSLSLKTFIANFFLVQPDNLIGSGLDLILAHTMYAIIGAISLEKGAPVANKVAQERILEPLGLKTVA